MIISQHWFGEEKDKTHHLYDDWMVLICKNLMSSSPKDALCQVWLKMALWFWRIFLNFIKVYSLFHNNLSLEKGIALHLNKLESSSHKDALCQVWLKLPGGSWEEDFKISSIYFHYFVIVSAFGKGVALYLNKIKSLSTKGTLCQVWLKLAMWFWRNLFLIFINVPVFSLFCYYLLFL